MGKSHRDDPWDPSAEEPVASSAELYAVTRGSLKKQSLRRSTRTRLEHQARVLSMGAALPCMRDDKPPRGPPPMARPPLPHLNACPFHDWNQDNDWRHTIMPNPKAPHLAWRHAFYLGNPEAPLPHHDARPPYWYDVPMKAPPPHLAARRGFPVHRDMAVIKAPPSYVFAVPKILLQASPVRGVAVPERQLPKNKPLRL